MLKILTVLLSVLFVSGCSMVEMAYNNAPAFLENRVEDAFELTPAQRDILSEEMQRFFAWHRQTELPEYARVLDQTAS